MASDGRAEFDPSEIARVDFPTAFRGYDQDAVRRYLSRLAAAVGRAQELGLLGTVDPDQDDERFIELEVEAGKLRQRIMELESRLEEAADASAGSSEPGQPLDEAELIKLLGAETARILETARSAAADMAKRAETEAAQVKQQSEADARARRDEADAVLAAARSEAADIVAAAEAEVAKAQARIKADTIRAAEESRADAERVLAEAASQAESELTSARQLAESELASARQHATELVTDAEEMRSEVLGDLVTRRRITREQLVVMNAARDRLAVALASARNELDDVTSVLQRAAPAHDEIDVRDPSSEVLAQAVATTSGSGAAADAQRAEVAELAALLDRKRPETANGAGVGENGRSNGHVGMNGSAVSGLAGASSVNGTTNGSSVNGSTNGSSPGASSNGGAGNGGPHHGNGSYGATNGAGAHSAGAGGATDAGLGGIPDGGGGGSTVGGPTAGGPGGGVAGSPKGPVGTGDGIPMEYLTVEAAGAVAVEDLRTTTLAEDEILVLTDTEHAVADRTRPASNPNELRLDAYGGLGGSPAPILGNGPGSMHRSATRGDLPRTTPYAGVLPAAFETRDVALSRATPGFRRRLKRAVNDDQSEVLERIRAGRGVVSVAELPGVEQQLDAYVDALRPVLFDVVTSGAEMLGCLDIPVPSVENLCLQLARHVVDCVRTPTMLALERATTSDREMILDPIRSIYRDFRNTTLPDLIEDALHEAFNLGLYHAVDPDELVLWATDPRLDPDPICEDNSASRALRKGTNFPSGHPRPLSMPGCRCLLIPAG